MPDSVIKHFYDGLDHGVLIGAQCKQCQHVTFPPTTACEQCGGSALQDKKLSGKGTLHFLSHGVAPPPNPRFADIAPYAYGHIVLEEGIVVNAIVRDVATDPKTMSEIYARGPSKVVFDVLRTPDLPVMAFKLVR
ncbi:MAG: hypothetical protein HS104_20460 [Polyangiaceae bacterium]|nr:hypothetical protein [Polyangiaceae bacterium]MCL4752637.1 hypothetical protein [Myxococcales bacterium]